MLPTGAPLILSLWLGYSVVEVQVWGEAVKSLSVGARPLQGTIKGCPRGLCLIMYSTKLNNAIIIYVP